MNEIRIPLETLAKLAAMEGNPLAFDVSPEMLCANIGSRYDFLPQPVEIRLADAKVTIRWADESEEDQAEAARLFERAGRRAREGEYERVAALCLKALSLQPALQEARRDLARACVETGDRANAEAALWQALWLNPRDTWPLVTLAGLLAEGGEADKAERLARMALGLEPANAEALDLCQGAIHGNPLDIVVETRMRAELPILAPVQFLSHRHFLPMPDALDLNPMLRRVLPRPLLQGVEALIGAFYLLADHLHGGATDFAARYKTRPTFRLMEKLVTHCEARFPDLGPGGHFDLVDEFAAQLGMQGLCGWRYFPAPPAPAAHTEAYAAVEPTKEPMPEPENPVLGLP